MTRSTTICTAICWAATLLASGARAAELAALKVYPDSIQLTTAKGRQSIVVQAVFDDGITRDVTSQAEWSVPDEQIARLEESTIYPVSDGHVSFTIEFGGTSVNLPIKVTEASQHPPISFRRDVMPIFMAAGCNTGSCHGAARGKDGFRLSLFGFDPAGDLFRITREQPGRRVNLAVPENSLIVEKATGKVPHTGGKRFDAGSEMHTMLLEWLRNNTPDDPQKSPTCAGIELYPPQAVFDGPDETQQMVVRATYSDGTTRDVTSLAVFLSNNDSSVSVSKTGLASPGARGEAFVMARFDTFTTVSQMIVLPKGQQFTPELCEPANYIDTLVSQKLSKLRLHPSPVCSDSEFLRRVTIDLVGLVPTTEEFEEFYTSTDPDKREKKVDELLARKEFAEIWVSKWAEWLMMRSNIDVSQKSIVLYYEWLVKQISGNVPLDKMVRDLLSASGGTFTVPQMNYYELERDPLKIAENTAQIFMGMRIQCAQCHNHPFDRWTQDDYYNFAALFSQIGRKRGEDTREQIVFNGGGGEVKHPVTGQNAQPVFLGGPKAEIRRGQDRRQALADWLVSRENPYFSRNFANRIWKHFFGIGIVEPEDDLRVSNPPSNPELLNALAEKLIETNYDFKAMVRDICNSNAYQRSTVPNESNAHDERNFARQTMRRIKAESTLDIISQVTGTKDDFARLPVGARAVQIADGATSTYFLTTFGRASRQTACTCEVKMEPTLSQALHLLNGDTVNGKIRQGGLVRRLREAGKSPEEIIERLYITCLTRRPTDVEKSNLVALVAESDNAEKELEDVFWALLNSREFLFNH
jgi:hypothetical protein